MKRVLPFVVLIVSGLFITSCKSNSKDSEAGFYYYPLKNVYYDLEKKIFLYSLDSAKTWRSVANASSDEPVTLGEKVILNKTGGEVFKNNEEHRKLYAGKLFHIIKSDTTLSTSPEVTERKDLEATRIASARSNNLKGKPKKGIKKFFEKIFGKKNQ